MNCDHLSSFLAEKFTQISIDEFKSALASYATSSPASISSTEANKFVTPTKQTPTRSIHTPPSSSTPVNTCQHIMISGTRKGEECQSPAKVEVGGKWFCGNLDAQTKNHAKMALEKWQQTPTKDSPKPDEAKTKLNKSATKKDTKAMQIARNNNKYSSTLVVAPYTPTHAELKGLDLSIEEGTNYLFLNSMKEDVKIREFYGYIDADNQYVSLISKAMACQIEARRLIIHQNVVIDNEEDYAISPKSSDDEKGSQQMSDGESEDDLDAPLGE